MCARTFLQGVGSASCNFYASRFLLPWIFRQLEGWSLQSTRLQKSGRRAFGDLGSIILVEIYGVLWRHSKGRGADRIAMMSSLKLPIEWSPGDHVESPSCLGNRRVLYSRNNGWVTLERCCKSFAKKWPFRATDFFPRSIQRERFTFRISIVYIGSDSGGWDFEIAMQSGAWGLVSPRISALPLEPTSRPPKQAKLCGRSLRRGVRCCPQSTPKQMKIFSKILILQKYLETSLALTLIMIL